MNRVQLTGLRRLIHDLEKNFNEVPDVSDQQSKMTTREDESMQKETLERLMKRYLKPPSYEESLQGYNDYLSQMSQQRDFKGLVCSSTLLEMRKQNAKEEKQAVRFYLTFGCIFSVFLGFFILRIIERVQKRSFLRQKLYVRYLKGLTLWGSRDSVRYLVAAIIGFPSEARDFHRNRRFLIESVLFLGRGRGDEISAPTWQALAEILLDCLSKEKEVDDLLVFHVTSVLGQLLERNSVSLTDFLRQSLGDLTTKVRSIGRVRPDLLLQRLHSLMGQTPSSIEPLCSTKEFEEWARADPSLRPETVQKIKRVKFN